MQTDPVNPGFAPDERGGCLALRRSTLPGRSRGWEPGARGDRPEERAAAGGAGERVRERPEGDGGGVRGVRQRSGGPRRGEGAGGEVPGGLLRGGRAGR